MNLELPTPITFLNMYREGKTCSMIASVFSLTPMAVKAKLDKVKTPKDDKLHINNFKLRKKDKLKIIAKITNPKGSIYTLTF